MSIILKLRQYRWYIIGRSRIKKQVKQQTKIKIILGSGTTEYDGWIATDLPHFNILKKKDWACFFRPNTIDNILAEHVLEHLTEQQVDEVLLLAYIFLKPNGVFRIAVPDKNHPNPEYIEYVRPGGSGLGAEDHKSFWDYKTFKKLAENHGFKVDLLEYADENKQIITSNYTDENGIISRSLSKTFKSDIKDFSSLIVDLIKP